MNMLSIGGHLGLEQWSSAPGSKSSLCVTTRKWGLLLKRRRPGGHRVYDEKVPDVLTLRRHYFGRYATHGRCHVAWALHARQVGVAERTDGPAKTDCLQARRVRSIENERRQLQFVEDTQDQRELPDGPRFPQAEVYRISADDFEDVAESMLSQLCALSALLAERLSLAHSPFSGKPRRYLLGP